MAHGQHLGPFRLGELPVDRQPFLSKDTRVRLRGAVEGIPIRSQFPFEEPPCQRFRLGFGLLARLVMDFLETFEDSAHVAVRVVDGFDRLFDGAEGVLGQFDDFGWPDDTWPHQAPLGLSSPPS